MKKILVIFSLLVFVGVYAAPVLTMSKDVAAKIVVVDKDKKAKASKALDKKNCGKDCKGSCSQDCKANCSKATKAACCEGTKGSCCGVSSKSCCTGTGQCTGACKEACKEKCDGKCLGNCDHKK